MSTTTRQTAEVRREAVLEAAATEFSRKGIHGALDRCDREGGRDLAAATSFGSSERRRSSTSPTTRLKMEEVYQAFERASRGKSGQEALHAMGDAYRVLIEDRERLQLMLQCFAAAEDDEIREDVRRVWRDLVELTERVSGATPEEISSFFAKGMLLNVLNAMRLFEDPTPWGDRLIEGCRPE